MEVRKVFSIAVVVLAVVLAVLYVTLPTDRLQSVVVFVRFFDVMLPILAAGALIKYIFCCGSHNQK